jgi:DNA-binding MarR family transcriptional regulator
MSDLAVRANSSPSRLSHAVARLEDRGWVRREPAPKDGRGTVAVLTEAGMDMLVRTAPGHVTAVREYLFDRLSADQVRELGDICGVVLDGLSTNRVAPSC